MQPPNPVQIIVCTHGDCRKAKGHEKVLQLASAYPGSATVPCQGICRGPVIGLRAHGDIRWFKNLRGPSRRALERLLRSGGSDKDLRKLEVRKRRGNLRHRNRVRPLGS
jgi:hypothetical protein